jgi:hypothetical protein
MRKSLIREIRTEIGSRLGVDFDTWSMVTRELYGVRCEHRKHGIGYPSFRELDDVPERRLKESLARPEGRRSELDRCLSRWEPSVRPWSSKSR